MTVNELKRIMVRMGYMPGKVDDTRGWLHVWSAEIDPRTKNFMACVSYDKFLGFVTENRLDGQERYYKYDDGDKELRRSLH